MKKELEVAILLIYVAEKAIAERRRLEAACGYPSEYGGDEFVLEKMREYLDESHVKERLEELLKQIKNKK